MSFVAEEISSRPACWREAARLIDPDRPRNLTRAVLLAARA